MSGQRRIIVDADACPSLTRLLKIAETFSTRVILVGNETQNLQRFSRLSHVRVIEVASTPDAADFAIMPMVKENDIVITNDIGLVSLVISKGANALSPQGTAYNPATIDTALIIRYEQQKIRRSGGRIKGPSPRTKEDELKLVETLRKLLGTS